MKTLQTFRNIILGCKITVYTDNRNNVFYKNIDTNRITNWKSLLREYDYSIQHIDGKFNIGADFISRNLSIKHTVEQENEKFEFKTIQESKEFIKNMHILLGHPGASAFYHTMRKVLRHRSIKKECYQICQYCILL